MIVAARRSVPVLIVAGKFVVLILIVADGLDDLWCGVSSGASSAGASRLCGASAVTFDVHLKDGGVVHEPVDGGSVIAGSGKTLFHSPKGWLAVISNDRRS